MDLVGSVIADNYIVEDLCGYDNCLTLYSVRHLQSGERSLLKVLPVVLSTDEKAARFKLQARALSSVTNANLVRLVDYGVLPDRLAYIITEKIEGKRLSQILDDEKYLPASRAVDLMIQVCNAIGQAHQAGLVHSALTPRRIFIVKDGDGRERAKVLDLGVSDFLSQDKRALAVAENIPDGASYASPEHCLDRVVDARSDVYTLGCILYQLLVGRRPYEGKNNLETVAKHASAIMPLPFVAVRKELQLPPVVENVVFKAMAKNPADRFQSALELKSALDQARASVEAPHVVEAFAVMLSQRREGIRREQALGRIGKIAVIGLVLVAVLLILQSLLQHFGVM
jgi:eukaryotic-like serine/threonine-protein kinase